MRKFSCACFLCLLFSFSLNAQDTPVDTIALPDISQEKADSLLVALSKGKSKGIKPSYEADPLAQNISPVVDIPAKDTVILNVEYTPDVDSLSPADTVQAVALPEKNRKKAKVERKELLTKREDGYMSLIGEGNVDYKDLRSVNEGTMLGGGGYRMRDHYLSQEDYGGMGFRFMNERMRLLNRSNNRVSRQNIVNIDVSSAINGAENANFLSAFADYSVGYHYRLIPHPYFKIMVGGSARAMLGAVYSTRNGNNPLTVHADMDLNFSTIAIYEFRIKKHPLAIRYQFETPFAGFMFSPVGDMSYYEIFSLGNTAEIFHTNSFNNKFAMRNHLTLDFPFLGMTVRTGYYGSYYSTSVHDVNRYIISHNVMVGFVKEFVAFGGREMRRRNLFRSAYY